MAGIWRQLDLPAHLLVLTPLLDVGGMEGQPPGQSAADRRVHGEPTADGGLFPVATTVQKGELYFQHLVACQLQTAAVGGSDDLRPVDGGQDTLQVTLRRIGTTPVKVIPETVQRVEDLPTQEILVMPAVGGYMCTTRPVFTGSRRPYRFSTTSNSARVGCGRPLNRFTSPVTCTTSPGLMVVHRWPCPNQVNPGRGVSAERCPSPMAYNFAVRRPCPGPPPPRLWIVPQKVCRRRRCGVSAYRWSCPWPDLQARS